MKEKQVIEGYYRKKKGGKRKSVFVKGYTRTIRTSKIENYCPRCRHYTLQQKGTIDKGKMEVWSCSRCGYRSVRSSNKGEEDE